MITKQLAIQRCDSCGTPHLLKVTYNVLNFPHVGLPPDPVMIVVEYLCPVNAKQTSTMVKFDSRVEVVDAVAV